MAERKQHYRGRERRRHQMYVTRNTEYHLRDGICVAVRDRQTGRWASTHQALCQAMAGSIRVAPNGTIVPSRSAPEVGDALFFETTGRELVTSALCAIQRPAKEVVEAYPAH